MTQGRQVRQFLDCWPEEVAGRGVEWGWGPPQVRAGQSGQEVYLVARAAHDGREDGTGRVIPSEARLHQPGAVVAHKSGGLLVVAHPGTASAGSAGGEPGGPPSLPAVALASSHPEERTEQRRVGGDGGNACRLPSRRGGRGRVGGGCGG